MSPSMADNDLVHGGLTCIHRGDACACFYLSAIGGALETASTLPQIARQTRTICLHVGTTA